MTDNVLIDDLLPCPFCGSHAALRSGMHEWWIACQNDDCMASTKMCGIGGQSKAMKIWNKRQPSEGTE